MIVRAISAVMLRWQRFSPAEDLALRIMRNVENGEALRGASSSGLVRTIGRWSLSALIVNSVIGGGVFGLPSVVAGRLGKYAPVAYLVAAAGIGLIAACLSEVASQFQESGGPY